MEVTNGTLTGLFSFDIGYEILLETLASVLEAQGGTVIQRDTTLVGVHDICAMDFDFGPRRVDIEGQHVEVRLRLRAHDFGAVTVMLQRPLSGPLESLSPVTAALVRTRALENVAASFVRQLLPAAKPAILRGSFGETGEDYYVIWVKSFDRPVTPAELIESHRGPIARTLRCEKERLATGEAEELFETAISYHPNDLVVVDWNAAFIFGTQGAQLLDAFEFLNVQLVELRFFDQRLDARINDFFEKAYRRPRLHTIAHNPYRRLMDEVAELKIETTLIAERVGNALKFIDDLYIAKVYDVTAGRLHLDAWRGSVESKLRVVHEIFEILDRRAATRRAEALELAIILLIAVEIVLSFWK